MDEPGQSGQYEPGQSGQYANINLGLNNDTPSSSSETAPNDTVQISEENSDQSAKTEPLTPQQQQQQRQSQQRLYSNLLYSVQAYRNLPTLFTIFFGGENVLYNITNSKKTLTDFRNTARVLFTYTRPRIKLILWTTYTQTQIQHLTQKYPQLLNNFDEILGDQYNDDTLQHPGVIAKIINRHNSDAPDGTPFTNIIHSTPVRDQGNVLQYLIIDDKIEKIDSNPEINRLVWDSNKILNINYDNINPLLPPPQRRTRGDHEKPSQDLAVAIHNKINRICPTLLGGRILTRSRYQQQ